MAHPFERIDPKKRARLWRWITALTILNMVILNYIGAKLNTDAAPAGIISYEFAQTAERAQAIIESWSEVRSSAFYSLGFDIPFPILYACSIALGVIWAGSVLRARQWPGAGLASGLAWGQWLAALLDYIENVSLYILLVQDTPSQPWPALAYGCAAVKFGFVIIGLLYALYGLGVRLIIRPKTDVAAA